MHMKRLRFQSDECWFLAAECTTQTTKNTTGHTQETPSYLNLLP